MATSSSAKKVAKLASRGKGKKVRFQGGTVFPATVAIVVVVLLLLVVYARQSRPSEGSGPPHAGIDHWHAAYGIYVCDHFLPKFVGAKEEQAIDPVTGQAFPADEEFRTTGIHSHGDGVIHYHPNSSRSSGNRARLGVFLDVYDVELSDSELVLPPDQLGPDELSTYDTDSFKCGDKSTKIVLRVWDHYDRVNDSFDRVTDFNNTRITNNGMVFTIAVVAEDDNNIPQPPWAPELPALGAADGAGDTIPPADTTPGGSAVTTTLAGTGTTVGGTETTTGTTVAGTTTSVTTTSG